MYGKGAGPVLAGTTTTAAGVAVLPNTGNSTVLLTLAVVSMAIGVLIVATMVVRSVAKRHYK